MLKFLFIQTNKNGCEIFQIPTETIFSLFKKSLKIAAKFYIV